eukprot:3931614-Rhodomonas_salina.1
MYTTKFSNVSSALTAMGFFSHMLSLIQMILYLIFALWALSKHNGKDLVSLHWGTPAPTSAFPQNMLAVRQSGEDDLLVQSCASFGNSALRDFQRCSMHKLPISFTMTNSQFSLWPGKSMNESYLVFALLMVHVMFAVLHLPLSQPMQNASLLCLRAFLLACIQVTSFTCTGVFLWEWGVSFSSAFFGGLMTVAATVYTWMSFHKERSNPSLARLRSAPADGADVDTADDPMAPPLSSSEFALATDQGYLLHVGRSVMTLPIMTYIILARVAPGELDFAYTIPIVAAILVCYGQWLLEGQVLTHLYGIHPQFNFKTEKFAYLASCTYFAVVYLLSIANETFYPVWDNARTADANSRALYMALLSIKATEFGTSLFLYAVDDVQ